jgi:hypothetical protein
MRKKCIEYGCINAFYVRNNQTRPLDCWSEVEEFKQAVAHEQKKFVANHQH